MIAQITTTEQIQTGKIPQHVPYFDRHVFLKEEASEKELSALYSLGLTKMTGQDLVETKTALNVIAYDPATKLINLMIENNVLALARTGVDSHPHLSFLSSILTRLKKEGGATHLALCLPNCLQKLLDVFVITGEFLPGLSPIDISTYGLIGNNNFVGLLKAARLAGYKLIAVEPNNQSIAFDPSHEQNMAKNILTILDHDQLSKIIFIAPDRHLTYLPVGEWLPTAGVLKKYGIKISTVSQFWHSDFMPKIFDCLLTGLSRPMALAARDTKMFNALQSKALPIEYIVPSNWDLTIIYPRLANKKGSLKQSLLKISVALSKNLFFQK
jgi:hypothetical protein